MCEEAKEKGTLLSLVMKKKKNAASENVRNIKKKKD